jgi:hypothetical protein
MVIAILSLGLFTGVWQFQLANNEAGVNTVSAWFGEWLVYGLVAYAVLRAVPNLPRGTPAVLASLLIVVAVNYKAYASLAEEREAVEFLARATPLLNRMRSGVAITDQEVRDARIGMMEPLILAQATYNRDVIALAAIYTKAIEELQPELILMPRSLATPSIREQTRLKLKVWQQATTNYKSQMDAATARGRLGIQAALSRMPTFVAEPASKGLEESSARRQTYMRSLISSEREASFAIAEILDLLDANPAAYVVDNGPPENLMFRNEGLLARYRQLMNSVVEASQRETEAQTRLLEAQTETANRLSNLLKR